MIETFERITQADQREIRNWPPYSNDTSPLDYALRSGGWLDMFPAGNGNRRFGFRSTGKLLGFTLLVDRKRDACEFYIAVHPEHLGRGIGRKAMTMTLRYAFEVMQLRSVHLKVREWHARAIELYKRLGFVPVGETVVELNGEKVRFVTMELAASTWRAAN